MNNNILCVVHVCKEAVQYTSKACLQVLLALDLSCNKIRDDGLRHLARALRVNQTLIFLGLSGNQIGDDGVKDFCKVREREGEG